MAANPDTLPKAVVAADTVRKVMAVLAQTYHGRGSVELGDPYKVLIATIISQRTREEQTTAVSERVFSGYPDISALAGANQDGLYELLEGSQYRETKAPRLIELARMVVDRFGGRVPDELDALLSLPGVGRKTANCTLIYAFDKPALCVDVHMHRITNRLGWVHTKTPDETERALEKVVPEICGPAPTASSCSTAGRSVFLGFLSAPAARSGPGVRTAARPARQVANADPC